MAKSQRPPCAHPQSLALARAVERVVDRAETLTGVAYRACAVEYANRDDLITGAGSKKNGGRWNPRSSFHAVYLSFDIEVALAEYLGQYDRFGWQPSAKTPLVIAAAEVRLRRVLDLTDGSLRKAIGVSLDRIVADDWVTAQDRGDESLTQAIGRIAYQLELEGLRVPSALRPAAANLVYFPANLLYRGSWSRIVQRGRLPKTNGQ